MPKPELLPGVKTSACPPAVVCDAKATVRRARRRAILRDAGQIALLLAVDYLFFHWPESRIPLMSRDSTLRVLELTNIAVAVHLWWTRFFAPKLIARRMMLTWSRAEQKKFTR